MVRWGTKPPPHSSLFCCCPVPHHPLHRDLCVLSLVYTCPRSPPTHWTFSPSYLCQIAWPHLDCLIRNCSTEAPNYLRSNYFWAASRPEICASRILLRLGDWIWCFSLHNLCLQQGKRQIPVARLSNLLLMYRYIKKKNQQNTKKPTKPVTIKSCPKYQWGENCQGGKVSVSSFSRPVLLLPARPENVAVQQQECKENAS